MKTLMNDTIILDSLKVVNNVLLNTTETNQTINWWLWVSILQFIFIVYLLLSKKNELKVNRKQKFKSESLKQNIDFDNIINSSFHSISLYDELKVKCHPDRFTTDKGKNAIAESLFQEITKNKTNVKKLLELKEEAKNKLNINF